MSMTFARHESFHLRSGWLRKGLNAIEIDDHIFLEDTGDAMDLLGIGKNMISSLRYWLQATGLTFEEYDSGVKVQKLTEFAKEIYDRDKYFEDIGTFWLLHYKLVNHKEMATTWHWFFNYFKYEKFDKDELLVRLIDYIKREGEEPPAESSLNKDLNVLIRMYLFDPEKNKSPEDTLESPFSDLRVFTEDDENYVYNKPSINLLSPLILYYCILDSIDEDIDSINIEDLLNPVNSVGRLFNFKPTDLYEHLEYLENKGYINVYKQAGLNTIRLEEKSKEKVLDEYYA